MTDDRKSNATKRYQNSDYPSGSFEAAISVDQGASGLRLVREPSMDGRARDDFEEMVPEFMHRDFFRTEEDASDPVPVVPPTRVVSASASPSGYMEPPNTEDLDEPVEASRPALPTAVIPPKASPLNAAPAKPVVTSAPSAAAPVVKSPPAAQSSAPEEPLSPLRSNEAPPAPEAPRTPPRSSRPEPALRSEKPEPNSPKATPAAASSSGTSASVYSLPLVAALAMVLGVFVWRESTRPVVVAQPALPVPQVATVVEQPAANPTSVPSGVSATHLAIGPPAPPVRANPNPTAVAEESINAEDASADAGSLFPGQQAEDGAEEAEEDADERAAIMQQMSEQAPPAAPVRVKSASSSQDNAGALFPVDSGAAPAKPKPKPSAPKPAAPKVAASKPASKPLSKPSAADLFPIDDEVPIRRPASANVGGPRPSEPVPMPALSTEPIAAPISSGSGDPYQIDEPNL